MTHGCVSLPYLIFASGPSTQYPQLCHPGTIKFTHWAPALHTHSVPVTPRDAWGLSPPSCMMDVASLPLQWILCRLIFMTHLLLRATGSKRLRHIAGSAHCIFLCLIK